METCHLSEFMQSIKPWLSDQYIRKVYLDDEGHFKCLFKDGVIHTYRIDDCTKAELKDVLKDLKEKGVPVEG